MTDARETDERHATAAPHPAWLHWLVLALLVTTASALRLYRIDDPVDGYHAYNEAWYAIVARNYEGGSLLFPRAFEIGVDYRTPPLYSYLIHFAHGLIADYVVAGRVVSTLSSAVAITFTWLLGRRAFGARAGCFAALLFGFAPVAVAVGRNAQTDMTYLAFLLGALHFYLRSRSAPGNRDAVVTGASFAAAFFTKYFAALLPLPVLSWELLQSPGRKRESGRCGGTGRKLGLGLAVFAVLIVPYHLYHLVTSFDAFTAQQIGGAVRDTQLALSWERLAGVLEEEIRGFSPLAAIVFAASIVYALVRREPHSTLFLACFLAYFALFYLNHHHSYYMLTQLPFLALLGGDLLRRIRPAALAAGVAALVALSASICSLLFLASAKYGWDVASQMVVRMTERSRDPVILLEQSLMDSTGPVLAYYCPDCELVVKERLDANAARIELDYDREIYLVKDDLQGSLRGYELVRHTRLCPTAFGRALLEVRSSRHAHSGLRERRFLETGDAFGLRPCRTTVAKAVRRLPQDTVLYTTNGRIRERRRNPTDPG